MKKLVVVFSFFAFLFMLVSASAQTMSTEPVMAPVMSPAPVMAVPVQPTVKTPVVSAMIAATPAASQPIMAEPKKEEVKKDEPKKEEIKKTEQVKQAVTTVKPVTTTSVTTSTKESGWDKADKWISRISNVIWPLCLIVISILGWASKAFLQKIKRSQKLWDAFDKYFPIIENLAKSTEWKGDDKLVQLIYRIEKTLRADNEGPLSMEELDLMRRAAADKAAEDKIQNGGEVDKKVLTEKESK